MAVTQVGTPTTVVQQSGTATGGTASITGTWSGTQPRTADDYLIACVTSYDTTSVGTIAESSGNWAQLGNLTASSRAQVSIFGRFAGGADVAPTFTSVTTGTAASERMTCYLIELTGVDFNSTVPVTGSMAGTSASPFAPVTGEVVATTGGYAISCYNMVSATGTFSGFTKGAAWTNVSTTAATSTVDHTFVDIFAGPPSGSTLTESVTHTTTTTFECAVIIVVQAQQTPTQPISNIADNFDSGVENPAVWNTGSNVNSVVFTGGAIQSTTSNTVAYYSSFNSFGTYNLTGGSLTEKLVSAGNQALVSLEIGIAEMHDTTATSLLAFYLNQNNLSAWYRTTAGNSFNGTVTYNPALHIYFRISESGGTTTWWTSPTGHAWTSFFSIANPVIVTQMFVIPLDVGTFSLEATATTVIYDNLNVIPPYIDTVTAVRQAVKRASLW